MGTSFVEGALWGRSIRKYRNGFSSKVKLELKAEAHTRLILRELLRAAVSFPSFHEEMAMTEWRLYLDGKCPVTQ